MNAKKQQDLRWLCPRCRQYNQEPMHTDTEAHFVSMTCDNCDHETEDCACTWGEIVDAPPGSASISLYFAKIGSKGGKVTAQKHKDKKVEWGRKGAEKQWKKKKTDL